MFLIYFYTFWIIGINPFYVFLNLSNRQIYGSFIGFREGLDSLKLLEILSQDQGENQSEHSNERRSRQIATRLVQVFSSSCV